MEPTTVTCSTACTVTLVVTPAAATPEQYAAVNTIFGATLGALVLIWGVKRIWRLFERHSDA